MKFLVLMLRHCVKSESINMYTCPQPDCLCTFQKYGNLHKHLDSRDHRMEKNTLTLADKSKEEYIHQIQSKPNKIIKAATTITTMSTMTLKKRWALKKRRTVKRFLSNQTSFLRDAFIYKGKLLVINVTQKKWQQKCEQQETMVVDCFPSMNFYHPIKSPAISVVCHL